MIKPDKLGFMDEDMKNLWFKLQPEDFREYRLYGGTALAMYLNHRKSTDFDFSHAAVPARLFVDGK